MFNIKRTFFGCFTTIRQINSVFCVSTFILSLHLTDGLDYSINLHLYQLHKLARKQCKLVQVCEFQRICRVGKSSETLVGDKFPNPLRSSPTETAARFANADLYKAKKTLLTVFFLFPLIIMPRIYIKQVFYIGLDIMQFFHFLPYLFVRSYRLFVFVPKAPNIHLSAI